MHNECHIPARHTTRSNRSFLKKSFPFHLHLVPQEELVHKVRVPDARWPFLLEFFKGILHGVALALDEVADNEESGPKIV